MPKDQIRSVQIGNIVNLPFYGRPSLSVLPKGLGIIPVGTGTMTYLRLHHKGRQEVRKVQFRLALEEKTVNTVQKTNSREILVVKL